MATKDVVVIANELIDVALPLDGSHVTLFGHGRPLGSRWNLSQGSVNLRPFRTLRRLLEFGGNQQDIDKFDKLYRPQGSAFRVAPTIGEKAMKEIFGKGCKVDASVGTVGYFRTLDFSNYSDVDTPMNTADVGRMMLADVTLTEQGIICTNRTITQEAAIQAKHICLANQPSIIL